MLLNLPTFHYEHIRANPVKRHSKWTFYAHFSSVVSNDQLFPSLNHSTQSSPWIHRREFNITQKNPDLPLGPDRGLSGGACVDLMLFPISLSPRARSLWHRRQAGRANQALNPLGGEWPSLENIVHHCSVGTACVLKGGVFGEGW